MNERYDKRLDIWMETREQALIWGLRYVAIEVL
jgi:3D (Asp-Asp-Asp) domain-containing protein